MDAVHHLLGLLDHGERGAYRSVSPALTDRLLARAADTHASRGHALGQGHQGLGGLLVGQGHHGLTDGQATSLHQGAAAWRHAEDVGVLAGAGFGHQEAGEVGVHAGIEQLAPSCRDGVDGVAQDVQQPNVIEPEAGHEGVLDEVLARLRQFAVLIVVPHDGQDLLGAGVDRHPVGDLEAGHLALEFMFKALDVQLAVALIDLAVAVVRVGDRDGNALLAALLKLHAIKLGHVGGVKVNVLVHAQDLHAPHHAGAHIHPVGDALGVAQVGGGVVHNQVFCIHRLRHRTVAEGAEVNLLERGAAEPQHQQHAVGVGVILGGHRSQVVIEVILQSIGQPVLFEVGVVAVVANLDRAIGGEQLAPGIGLEAQYSLKEQGVANAAHTLYRGAVSGPLEAWDFDFEAQEAQAGGSVLNPILAALLVI